MPTARNRPFPYLIKSLRLCAPFLWQSWQHLLCSLAGLLLMLAGVGLSTAMPWLWAYTAGHYAALAPSQLTMLMLALASGWAAAQMLSQLRRLLFFRIANSAVRDIRLRLIMHLHRLPLQQQQAQAAMHVLTAQERVSMTLRRFLASSFLNLPASLLQVGSLSVAITYLYPPALAVVVASLLWLLAMLTPLYRALAARQQAWRSSEETMRWLDESLQRTRFVRFHQQQERQRLEGMMQQEARLWWREGLRASSPYLAQAVGFFALVGGLLLSMQHGLRSGSIRPEVLLALKGSLLLLYRQQRKVLAAAYSLLLSGVDMQRVLELLELPPMQRSLTAQPTPRQGAPLLQAEGAWLQLPTMAAPVLKDICLTIRAGEKVALSGPSGSGKTMLCHLLAGLYAPTRGSVRLQGKPLGAWSPQALGKQLCFVSQGAALLSSSVAQNVGSSSRAGVLGYLNGRLQAGVGDRGSRLSGGERQRILVARALTQRPQLLILDETLCALDAQSALEILAQVLAQVPTVLMVTHHAYLLARFQKHFRLEDGQLHRGEAQ